MRTLVLGLVLAAGGCRQWLDLDRFEDGSSESSSSTSASSAGSGGAAGSMGVAGSMGAAGESGAGGSASGGCGGAPAGSLYVFVSAAAVIPSVDFKSVAEAGALCRAWAAAAGLTGYWNAWLSETGTAATTQLMPATGPWHRCNGQVAVSSTASLSTLSTPINIDEYGRTVAGGYAWTGTRADLMLGDSCTDWDAGGSPILGTVGSVDASNGTWTESMSFDCDGIYRLYCFQTNP
ncbi:MAG TPA: hypothetical protein VFB62_06120 [Polyangiaceae bacterium]|jgi:hypothetical protein|nr:hypothetical protein [Polyangiaceae bacterium]